MSVSILALGDSYTIGEGVSFHQNYPSQLASKTFLEHNQEVKLEVIAKTGWTTNDLLQELQNNPIRESNYTFVFLLIGVNNQYQGKSLDEYKNHLATFAQLCLEKAAAKPQNIFWISIPDYSVTPFAKEMNVAKIEAEITDYNHVFSDLARQNNFQFVDITDISRKLDINLSFLVEDQLHPSAKMYQAWVEKIFPVLKPLLP